jgi:hypothetical protein
VAAAVEAVVVIKPLHLVVALVLAAAVVAVVVVMRHPLIFSQRSLGVEVAKAVFLPHFFYLLLLQHNLVALEL